VTSELEARGYRVLGTLAQGGMAELLVAERRGAAGVHKILALKRLLPEMGKNPRFVKMFRNEARIAVELQHANIVPVFEFGEADGQMFLAMDYVRGWDLSRVLGACVRRGMQVPVDIALHIAIEVTKALAYAHEKRGPSGEALGIVHRDVTPGNILLSAEGEVKLADFGIARVTSSARTSTEGDVLGKLPYLSPEQARAERLDARSDLYSLGINLYEMVTGRRLFNADTAGRLMSAVRNPRVVPLAHVLPGIHPEVDAAVMRALASDREQRYASARAMQEALSRALHVSRPAVHPSDVRAFIASLELPPPPEPSVMVGADATTLLPSLATGSADPQPPRASSLPAMPASRTMPVASASRRASGGAHRLLPLVIVPALGVAFTAAFLLARASAPAARARLEVRCPRPGAHVFVDGQDRGEPPLVMDDLAPHVVDLRVEAAGSRPYHVELPIAAGASSVVDVDLDPGE